ncbi:Regulatory protein [Trichinella spiralis]|uniref:Regulatory protein n=1 Tax=Trichinella spiralis TaxID=6334 RepID=A0ABR3K3K4_TRISP
MLLLLFLKQTGPSPFNDGLARCQLVEKRGPKRAHAGTTIVDLVTLRSGCNCLSCWPGSAAKVRHLHADTASRWRCKQHSIQKN